ncbi:MAG: glycosyltransferase [Nanoarchaeota archaeon]|nr:glycosyltransferase [Nanoarchaeota archaeon]
MRIFSAVYGLKVHSNFDSMEWGKHMNTALRRMGHDLIEFDWDINYSTKKSRSDWEKKEKYIRNKQLVEKVQKAHEKKKIDLFLSIGREEWACPEGIEKIKKLGLVTLNFVPDDIWETDFMEHYKNLALVYDYNWTIQMNSFKNYTKIGATSIYAPPGADPYIYKPYSCERDLDVVFMGSNFGYRKKLLQTIVDAGLPLRICGGGWYRDKLCAVKVVFDDIIYFCWRCKIMTREEITELAHELLFSDIIWYMKHLKGIEDIFGPGLPLDESVKMYSRSKITLNFSGTGGPYERNFYKSIKAVKGRDVEAPMSGAFYLTEYTDDIAQLYKIGKEIEIYRSIPELLDKIKYYLENPNEVEAIREAGRKRALQDYTWEKCFEKIFDRIGLLKR